ncbi:MAG: acyl--CoA ligase [Corallococcus sp.]|nr:acyl--CoA ligase [Corallococcus sp.]
MSGIDCSMYSYLKECYNSKNFKNKALYFAGEKVSYKTLFANVDKCAAAICGYGLKKGDCITVALPNMPVAVYLVYAAAKCGVTVNLVHPLLPVSQISAYCEQTKSRLTFVFDGIVNAYADKLKTICGQVVLCGAHDNLNAIVGAFYKTFTHKLRSNLKSDFMTYKRFLNYARTDIAESDVCGCDDAVIMHSSGTVDIPKSVVLSHKALNVESYAIISGISNYDGNGKNGILAQLPMFHAFGLGCCIHCALCNGVMSVLIPKYSARIIVKYIRRGLLTILAGVPTMYREIVEQKGFDSPAVKHLITAFCGGDVLDEQLKNRFDAVMKKHGSRCRLHDGYGMTEIGGVFSANKDGQYKSNSNGKPLIETFRAEAFADGEKLPRGTTGELCLSSDAIMTEYLDDAALTAATVFEYNNAKWLKTGDLGYIDEDGYLHFVSRIKRVVKVSGVNVFPAQVEKTISELSFVKMVAVKEVKNCSKGHILAAYIVFDGKQCTNDVVKYCKMRLDKWSCPRVIYAIDKMPLTNMGKIDYSKLIQPD